MLYLNSTFVVRAEHRRVCCCSNLDSRTDLLVRNGFDFEVLSDSHETYPENGHYLWKAEINNVWRYWCDIRCVWCVCLSLSAVAVIHTVTMVCSSCYWKPELKDCKSDNSLSLTEMIGTTAKELPSKRALELSELKLITMFKTVSTLERGLGVERAKTPFFRGLPRRPTKLDDIHGSPTPIHACIL